MRTCILYSHNNICYACTVQCYTDNIYYSIIMNAFLLSCTENKMPGGYWSRTGTVDLTGALLHQKNEVSVQCRSSPTVGETEIRFPSHCPDSTMICLIEKIARNLGWLHGNRARTGET